jgi:hypothetical protein
MKMSAELSGQRKPTWDIPKVDVIYLNINTGSDFRTLRTGTDKTVHEAIVQVSKHIQRGLYELVSLNASKHSCVVVISTEKARSDLVFKHGFPWDIPEDPQAEIAL